MAVQGSEDGLDPNALSKKFGKIWAERAKPVARL